MKKILLALTLMFSMTAMAGETIQAMCTPNDAGGEIIISSVPCSLKVPFDTGGTLYDAVATEANGTVHKGCWQEGEGVVNLFFEEYFDQRAVANFNPALFTKCAGF